MTTSENLFKEGDDGKAVAEHAWKNHHPIDWEDITVLEVVL